MEIKSKLKANFDNILKCISAVVSIILTSLGVIFFIKYLIRFTYVPLVAISMYIILIMLMITIYMYLYAFFKVVSKKKILRSILLMLPIIICGLVFVYIKSNVNYLFRNSVLMITYILGVVLLPLIMLGTSLLSEKKHRSGKIIISVILLLYIYIVNFTSLIIYAQMTVENLSGISIKELMTPEPKETLDLSYLEEYKQKMAREGYLTQFDVKNILNIVDSKSMKIFVNYKDELSNINIQTINKKDDEINSLKESLKAEYYKFNYDVNENNEIVVNVERYMIDKKVNSIEKNNSTVLLGNKKLDIIENINKYYVSDNAPNFLFENKINVKSEFANKTLNSLQVLFVYDKESCNYVPVVEDTDKYSFIKSYKVYSDGIEITLKDEIKLEKQDYTLRINRYDDKLEPSENNSNYYYEYEPVVNKMYNSDNNIILEIRFGRSYIINELKNIEVIF